MNAREKSDFVLTRAKSIVGDPFMDPCQSKHADCSSQSVEEQAFETHQKVINLTS